MTAISFAADGVSYASSGRSVTDHAVSVAANQDCALLRVADGKPICRKFRKGEETEMVIAAREWAAGPEVIGQNDYEGGGFIDGPAVRPDPGTIRVASAKTNFKPAIAVSRKSAVRARHRATNRAVDLVIGSYKRLDYARVAADRLAYLDPKLVRVKLSFGMYYRIVLRARDAREGRDHQARLRAAGVKYWIAPACQAAGCTVARSAGTAGAHPS